MNDDEPVTAFLFDCDAEGVFAVSLQRSGADLPARHGPGGWRLKEQIELGVRQAMTVPIDPEPVLRGIHNAGFYVWREGAGGRGTTQ